MIWIRLCGAAFFLLHLVDAQCNDGWSHVEETHSCFKLFKKAGNWYEQRDFCQSENGQLASLTTAAETDHVKALIMSDAPAHKLDIPWLGLHSPQKNCKFEWLDGTPLNTSAVAFKPRQPDHCRSYEFHAHVRPHSYFLRRR